MPRSNQDRLLQALTVSPVLIMGQAILDIDTVGRGDDPQEPSPKFHLLDLIRITVSEGQRPMWKLDDMLYRLIKRSLSCWYSTWCHYYANERQ